MAINCLSVKIVSLFFQCYGFLVLDPGQLLANKCWVCTLGMQSHVLSKDSRDLRGQVSPSRSLRQWISPSGITQTDKTPTVALGEDSDFHHHPMTMTQSPSLKSLSVAVTGSAEEKKMSTLGSRNLYDLESEDLSAVTALHLLSRWTWTGPSTIWILSYRYEK